jgi:hypothetical protein
VNKSFPALNIVAKPALIRSLEYSRIPWSFEGEVNAGIIRKVAEGVASFPQ